MAKKIIIVGCGFAGLELAKNYLATTILKE
jgi:NADH dehydrogenase FAD-containing subunit